MKKAPAKMKKKSTMTMKKKSVMRKDVPTERQANMRAERKANKAGSKLRSNDPLREKLFNKAENLSDARYKRNKAGDPMKMKKAPMKKALVGKQANLPKALRDKILASPGKMLKPAAMKMMKKAPAKMMKKAPAKMMKKKK
tara:strand:- start:152 stop:574 length:423 start_codon:yes stop_codon:yes gene_type:complete